MTRPTRGTSPVSCPVELFNGLSQTEALVAETWWKRLPRQERVRLAGAYDPRSESSSFVRVVSGGGLPRYQRIAVRVAGVLRSDPVDRTEELFPIDFYEWLVNHEIYLVDGPPFHICTQHPAAALAVRSGTIPSHFQCPLASASCPMRQPLDASPGCSLQLVWQVVKQDPKPDDMNRDRAPRARNATDRCS